MHGATVWLLAALAVALVGTGVVGLLWLSRTSTLTNRVGSFACSLAPDPGGPWRTGVAQYGRVRMYWWRRASIVPRAAAVWERAGIVILERQTLPARPAPGERPVAVFVRCRVTGARGERVVCLQMSPDAYAGFTSWIEATPTSVGSVI